MTGLAKFDELRVRTDRELIQLAQHELDRGILAARQALNSDNRGSTADPYLIAKKSYSEAARLILLVRWIGCDERSGTESRLERLREMLAALSATRSTPPAPTKEEVAVLARSLWQARGCPEELPEEDWFRAERALKAHSSSHSACGAR
jgi:hypothetical protein